MNQNPAKEITRKESNKHVYRLMECYTSDRIPAEIHIYGYEIQCFSNDKNKWYAMGLFPSLGKASQAFECL